MEFTPGPWEARIMEGGLLDGVWVVTDCDGGLVPRTKENTQLQLEYMLGRTISCSISI